MTASLPVLIAGGGIGGLATALALARRGISAHVLERRARFSEAGAGIQFGPNGVRVLRYLGIDRALAAQVGRPDVITVFEGATGSALTHLPLGRWIEDRHGAPYWVAHRRDVQNALLSAIASEPKVTITNGFVVDTFTETPGAVCVRAADGRAIEGRALLCADGIFSHLRGLLFPGTHLAFAGKTASRTVLDASLAAPFVDTATMGVWLAPDAHVVHYPVRSGRDIAIVAIIDEDWREEDWGAPADRNRLMGALERFAPRLQHMLAEAQDWRRWALFQLPPLHAWTRGRVALLGDAAHPVLPFLAQGGGMALEDAVTLAHHVGQAADGEEPRALAAYARARRSRVARVAAASRRNGRLYHLSGLPRRVRDMGLRTLPPALLMGGYDWLYAWDET